MGKVLEPSREIERSIMKKYRKELWNPFIQAVKNYELVQENDKIAVCISGGKDSMLMAKLMQLLQRYGDVPFELVFLVMDPGYNEYNRSFIEDNAKILNVPVEFFESDIFDVVEKMDSKSACYMCARMRRGFLYKKAQELGCNKIALGHHFDDVIETTLLSMFYASEIKTMLPKLHSDNFEGIELIRPLYLVKEQSIITWKKHNELTFINCACRFTESCSVDDTGASKRQEIKTLIKRLKRKSPVIEHNIFKSMENINLNAIVGYKENGKKHSFLENY